MQRSPNSAHSLYAAHKMTAHQASSCVTPRSKCFFRSLRPLPIALCHQSPIK